VRALLGDPLLEHHREERTVTPTFDDVLLMAAVLREDLGTWRALIEAKCLTVEEVYSILLPKYRQNVEERTKSAGRPSKRTSSGSNRNGASGGSLNGRSLSAR
jgi:hypothetical protein